MAFAPGLPILIGLSGGAWYCSRPVCDGVLLGLAATAQVFTGEEVLFQAVLGAVLVLVISALSGEAGDRGGGTAGAFSGGRLRVFLPITATALPAVLRTLKEHGSPSCSTSSVRTSPRSHPTTGLAAQCGQAVASAKFAGGPEEHLAYLGWPLLITCLLHALFRLAPGAGAVRAAGLLLAMALSLGGRLWVKGSGPSTPAVPAVPEAAGHRGVAGHPVRPARRAVRAALLAFAVQMLRARFSNRLVARCSRRAGRGLPGSAAAHADGRRPGAGHPAVFHQHRPHLPTGSVLLCCRTRWRPIRWRCAGRRRRTTRSGCRAATSSGRRQRPCLRRWIGRPADAKLLR